MIKFLTETELVGLNGTERKTYFQDLLTKIDSFLDRVNNPELEIRVSLILAKFNREILEDAKI